MNRPMAVVLTCKHIENPIRQTANNTAQNGAYQDISDKMDT